LPFIQVLIVLQDVNAAMLPILLVFIILLVNNRRLMGRRANGRITNILSWVTIVTITVLVVVWLLNALFGVVLSGSLLSLSSLVFFAFGHVWFP
jgi:Mn2+/Fe2+ NRAMP family transporter